MKKLTSTLLCFGLLLSMFITTTSASTYKCPYYPQISSIINLVEGPIVMLDGEKNSTYWEFEDISEAFSIINNIEHKLITELSNRYNLETLSFNNWIEYQYALEQYTYNDKLMSSDDFNNSRLRIFFEVCDNVIRNKKILDLYSIDNYSTEEMAMLLPYFSPYYIEYINSRNNIQTRAVGDLNINDMVAYAEKHGESRNYSYRSFSSDCTNFVSQIAKAGGAAMVNQGETSLKSWYYKGANDYSVTWVRADAFVKRYGVAYSTTNFYSFSLHAGRGDFIAYDSEMDGKWNHCAFVVRNDASVGSYDSGTYRDFRVAQHTDDYVEWVSYSRNSWEYVDGLKAVITSPRTVIN